jgi:hypothetical protein
LASAAAVLSGAGAAVLAGVAGAFADGDATQPANAPHAKTAASAITMVFSYGLPPFFFKNQFMHDRTFSVQP